MILYKKILLLVSLASILNAESLKDIILSTLANNDNIKAAVTENQIKQANYNSVENIYNPTAIIGLNYSKLDLDKRESQVGTTTAAFLKISIDLYDGGKNVAIKKAKEYEYKSSTFKTSLTKKETILQVVTLFFQIKTVTNSIKVFEEKGETLRAQYEKMKTKYDIKMVTIDEVLKLQSEYEANQYNIEDLKYQKTYLFQNLKLFTNKDIKTLDDSTLPEVKNLDFKDSENIKSLELGIKASNENVKVISSTNKPQLKIENIVNKFDYNDFNDQVLKDLPEQQNQLLISLSYNLFDTTSAEKRKAAKLESLALNQKLTFIMEQEKMRFELAKQKLTTQLFKIDSLKSAVDMGQSVYDIIKIKYNNGIVDNITYLDALSKNVYNKALYKQALNDYEIAKANYYFSSGVDYKSVLKSW